MRSVMGLGGTEPGEGWIGRDLGSYHLLRILGTGGMGIVFEAEHRLLGRRVAIKTIRPDVANDHSFSRRFLLEARAIASLDDPGIVGLHDFAFEGSIPYMVMEYVTGRTLEDLMHVGRLAAPGLLRLLEPVAKALDHAHQHGVVHRDIKPGNILLADDGRTLVMDFGLACLAGFTMATDPESFLGTPDYISPEQVSGQVVDGRCDIYSLGAVIFEAVSGEKPFPGRNWIEIASRRLLEGPPRISSICPDVPFAFSESLAGAMDRDPDKRPETARELLTRLTSALDATASGGPPVGPPSRPSSRLKALLRF
jgi:eukaryotic-like serine/threonine-protein kinase